MTCIGPRNKNVSCNTSAKLGEGRRGERRTGGGKEEGGRREGNDSEVFLSGVLFNRC